MHYDPNSDREEDISDANLKVNAEQRAGAVCTSRYRQSHYRHSAVRSTKSSPVIPIQISQAKIFSFPDLLSKLMKEIKDESNKIVCVIEILKMRLYSIAQCRKIVGCVTL